MVSQVSRIPLECEEKYGWLVRLYAGPTSEQCCFSLMFRLLV